ncbi:MAG: heat-inducible transcription repressor HrcA [Solobacterium sp.]|nr:heat-inducible transcription repressor HrcA [Solobacterium sp.]
MLTPRRIEIFKAIVDEFIKTAEPVGSKTLQKKYSLPYSSATIRNDMQVLEEMGYLEKTHTSSGRVPSTQGYKFYCENLLNDSHLDKRMEVAISKAFDLTSLNVEEAVQASCRILSEMTNMTAGAIGPDASTQTLEHIKIFPIDQRNAVCVFITNTGHTETKNFRFEDDVPISDIESCTDIMNARLKGVPIAGLPQALENIRGELSQVVKKHEILFTAFVKAFIRFASENVYFSGKDKMLYHPEFEDISKLKKLMSMFDNSMVWKELGTGKGTTAVTTRRGAQLTWVDDVAVVRSKFEIGDGETGELMVVGPTRMDYEMVVNVLGYAANMIEKIYKGGGNDEQ